MKILQTLSVLSISTLLVACISDMAGLYGPEVTHLKDAAGMSLYSCKGVSLSTDSFRTEGFWEVNNLPYGTTEFVCKKDGKAYLPVDCQGNSLNDKQIRAYWKEHQLPKGLDEFDCSTGEPKVPANAVNMWHGIEQEKPTCGTFIKKPCI